MGGRWGVTQQAPPHPPESLPPAAPCFVLRHGGIRVHRQGCRCRALPARRWVQVLPCRAFTPVARVCVLARVQPAACSVPCSGHLCSFESAWPTPAYCSVPLQRTTLTYNRLVPRCTAPHRRERSTGIQQWLMPQARYVWASEQLFAPQRCTWPRQCTVPVRRATSALQKGDNARAGAGAVVALALLCRAQCRTRRPTHDRPAPPSWCQVLYTVQPGQPAARNRDG